MSLKSDAKFEEKLTWGLNNDKRNLANFHQSTQVSKLELWWGPFIQSTKCMSLQFKEELYIMTKKNDAKFEEELTCRFKNWHHNLTNFDPSTRMSQKMLHFNGLLLTKVYNVWAKKVQKSYVWWHWRLMQNLKENWLLRNLANFHRLRNSDFILESKMAEVHQNTNSKQLDRPDAVRKLYFTLK